MTLAPNSLQARDIAYMVHPYTNLRQHERQGPLVITGGDGVFVIDDDGKRYIEGLAGLWCTGAGLQREAAGRGGAAADGEAALHPQFRAPLVRTR